MSEIAEIKAQLARMNEFLDGKWEPHEQRFNLAVEEQSRLNNTVRGMMDQSRTASILSMGTRSNDRPRVVGGKYDGMDALDLALARGLQLAMETTPQNLPAAIVNALPQWKELIDNSIRSLTRALDSTTAGSGDELVATATAASLWADVNLQTSITSLFTMIPMPTDPFEMPLELGDVNWYTGTPNVAVSSTDPATANRTLTAFELAAAIPWSLNLDEDAVIAVLAEFRSTLVRNAAEVMDDVVLNADTTVLNNINADGTTISVSDAGKSQWLLGFDGLRHIPLVDNTTQGNDHSGVVTDDMWNEIRALLGKYGVRPSECAFITDVNTFIRSQSIANMRTLDKFGPQATILTGQLGAVEGIPVIVSEQMRLADTDGLVTDSGNGTDTGSLMLVNRTQFRRGMKRELLIETDRDIQKRQTIMVASFRIAFEGRNANGSDTAVALQFNITGVA